MHWKRKAAIQNMVARLPDSLSYHAYYALQRTFGRIERVDLERGLRKGLRLIEMLDAQQRDLHGATILEIGTGRRLGVPLACWLCGAQQVLTVDLNPYLRPELVLADLAYLRGHADNIRELFGAYAHRPIFGERLDALLHHPIPDLAALLALTNIHYFSPADARQLPLREQCVDYHISTNVLEHVPPPALAAILHEARRTLKRTGLFVHVVDLSDHFAHTDRSISAINFLQFDDATWHQYAGNRYMYQNRLRASDYLALLDHAEFAVIEQHAHVDARSLALLQAGFPVAAQFQQYAPTVNATVRLDLVARPEERNEHGPCLIQSNP